MTDQQMTRELLGPARQELDSQAVKSASAIDNDDRSAVRADLDAGRVPSIADRGGPGLWQRASRTPELNPHLALPAQSPFCILMLGVHLLIVEIPLTGIAMCLTLGFPGCRSGARRCFSNLSASRRNGNRLAFDQRCNLRVGITDLLQNRSGVFPEPRRHA